MYRRYLFVLLFMMFVSYSGCSQDHTDQTQTLATINDYRLSLKDFQRQLAGELEFNPDAKLNKEIKKAFLDEIIRKEIRSEIQKETEINKAKAVLLNEKIRKIAPKDFNSGEIIRKFREERH